MFWRAWFCKHEWRERVRTVVASMRAPFDYYDREILSRWSPRRVELALSGSTSVLYECGRCAKLQKFTLRGTPTTSVADGTIIPITRAARK